MSNRLGPSVQALAPSTHQSVSYTGTAGTISSAVSDRTEVVRVVCTTDAHVSLVTATTATSSSMYVPAGVPEYLIIAGGEKVSAIQANSAGSLHVTEVI